MCRLRLGKRVELLGTVKGSPARMSSARGNNAPFNKISAAAVAVVSAMPYSISVSKQSGVTNTVQLRGRTTSRDTRKLYYVSHRLIRQGIQELRTEERAQQN